MISPFVQERRNYQPRYPASLEDLTNVAVRRLASSSTNLSSQQFDELAQTFTASASQEVVVFEPENSSPKGSAAAKPLKLGVLFSGGPAPGGHNVIAGLFAGIKSLSAESRLVGFLGGPSGLIEDKFRELDADTVAVYLNTGGFDLLGSGRTKLEKPEQFERAATVLRNHGLDGLCIIGGDDSNTNAALMAEYFAAKKYNLTVIGVPKTIDGDLKNNYVATTFGFDTAVRVYAELISNVARDTLSAKKYYHFIRLMGRAASHITLDAALLTHPNITLISEEVAASNWNLSDVVTHLCEQVVERAECGANYGIVLVPEGLIEFIPEIRDMISELNAILASSAEYFQQLRGFTEQIEFVNHKLSKDAAYTLAGLPIDIQRQVLMDRDPHGNVIVSQIETDRLLIELMQARLKEMRAQGEFKGEFRYQRHFFGYEGRCAAPTNFDADYAYSLGRNAAALFFHGYNGYMSVIYNLNRERRAWLALGVPLVSMMTIEKRHGRLKPVIQRSVVDLSGPAFARFQEQRRIWLRTDSYRFCGPIQYFGPATLCDSIPESLSCDYFPEL